MDGWMDVLNAALVSFLSELDPLRSIRMELKMLE